MIEIADKLPQIADPEAYRLACDRVARLFKNAGVIANAKFGAAVHERAADYIEQAPVLAIMVLPEDRRRKVAGGDRAYAAHKIANYCVRGARLKEVMAGYQLPLAMRKLKAKALSLEDTGTLRMIARLPPSVLSQAIPNSIVDQRRWLSAIGEWNRFGGMVRRLDQFVDWAVVQMAKHKVRRSQVGVVTDFIVRGDVPFNTAWEWPRAIAAADDWHDRLSAGDAKSKFGVLADQVVDLGDHPDHTVLYGYEFVALRTPTAIHAEGKAMYHCVASYVSGVVHGLTHIVSVRRDEQRIATLELAEGRVHQLKGRFNATVAPDVATAARQYADDVRAARRLAQKG